MEKFMISHHKSNIDYPQKNGQVESTNKTLGKILTKFVNTNRTHQDVMLVIVQWAYRTTYKVTTQYTPFQLVYDIQPIMPT